uniref:Uncharacterized protein n=1 Tax=Anguilla anguilla TaxID=7936 RepID=A0A0E9Q5S4_ANGAN
MIQDMYRFTHYIRNLTVQSFISH